MEDWVGMLTDDLRGFRAAGAGLQEMSEEGVSLPCQRGRGRKCAQKYQAHISTQKQDGGKGAE